MKVTKQLLEKYWKNACSPEEKAAVENWLSSPEEETTDLDFATMDRAENRVWQQLSKEMSGNPVNSKPITSYKKIARYATAACLALAFFSAGYFLGLQDSPSEPTVALNETKQQLHISTSLGKVTKIDSDKIDLSFKGMLQLYNASISQKMITCGTKTFVLEPFEVYYLSGSDSNPSFIKEVGSNGHIDLTGLLTGHFRIKGKNSLKI